jgi:hypothetical protein
MYWREPHADSNCKSGLKLQNTVQNNQTFSLLVDMTEKLYQLWHSIGIDEDVHVWIEISTGD